MHDNTHWYALILAQKAIAGVRMGCCRSLEIRYTYRLKTGQRKVLDGFMPLCHQRLHDLDPSHRPACGWRRTHLHQSREAHALVVEEELLILL